jgi:hypothetical protein
MKQQCYFHQIMEKNKLNKKFHLFSVENVFLRFLGNATKNGRLHREEDMEQIKKVKWMQQILRPHQILTCAAGRALSSNNQTRRQSYK